MKHYKQPFAKPRKDEQKMKKMIAFILIASIMLGVCGTAYAQELPDVAQPPEIIQETPDVSENAISLEEQETPETAETEPKAQAVANDFAYRVLSSSTAEIIRYVGSATTVTVPASLESYSITAIGEYAFHQSHVESVTIPNSVKTIGAGAFSDCASLRYVKLPDALSFIPEKAFYRCRNLDSIVFPKSLADVGASAFEGCSALRAAEFTSKNISFGTRAFAYCTSLTRLVLPSNNMDVLPPPISGREDGIFAHCTNLKEVTMPQNMKYLISYMFYDCPSLKTVTLPQALVSVGANDFEGCSALESITLPSSVKEISGNAFKDCTSLKTVRISGLVTTIEGNAFANCPNITMLTLPHTLTSVSSGAFAGSLGANTTIYGVSGTYAETYAKSRGCKFTADNSSVKPAKPVKFKAKAYSGRKIRIYWQKDATVDGYYVYRSTVRTGKYKRIKTLKNVRAYTDRSLAHDAMYYYKLVPYRLVGGKKIKGPTSAVVSALTP